MNDGAGGLWHALRLAYAHAQREGAVPVRGGSVLPPQASPAPLGHGLGEDLATRIDLAEERAAILEFEAGLTRAKAEALACHAQGLPPPSAKT